MSEMHQIQVPGPDFWTITPFRLDLPSDWNARQMVEHLVFASAPDGESDVSVRWSRVPAGFGLEKTAQISLANLMRVDDTVAVGLSGYGKLNGLRSYTRVVEFDPGSGNRRGQSYFAVHGPDFGSGRPVELFEITGHFPAGDTARLTVLQAITASFRFALQPQAIAEPSDLVEGA